MKVKESSLTLSAKQIEAAPHTITESSLPWSINWLFLVLAGDWVIRRAINQVYPVLSITQPKVGMVKKEIQIHQHSFGINGN